LSSDGSFAFDDDINDGTMGAGKAGETRTGTWDIGFDEYLFAPTITSVIHTPSTVKPSSVITFSVDWNDGDSGENIKAKICKTNSLTNQNCDGGHWATSTAFTTTDPEQVTYTAQEADKGSHHDYYAFVCDDGGLCSGSTYGAFYVGYGTQINSPLTGKFESGLVGYWSFNGQDVDWSTNTAYDRSGQSNNGAITNMSTSTDAVPGISGQALDFDGSDDYVDIPDDMSFTSFSAAGWFKPEDKSDWQAIVTFGDGTLPSEDSKLIHIRDTDKWRAYVRDSDGDLAIAEDSDTLTYGQWYFVASTFDAAIGKIILYVNGVQKATQTNADCSGIADFTTSRISSYYSDAWTQYFNGTIDEVRIYNRALSADEVMELYRAGSRKFQIEN